MIACPVNAYEKDPVTGIVKHLDDQCFGCQYCTLACPYDVPKYHPGKGIVRKCDMCSSRLAVGEAPACVQACPHEAIAIRIVDRPPSDRGRRSRTFSCRPRPIRRSRCRRRPIKHASLSRETLLPADYYDVNPQHAHWPLVVMLVLTQLSVGAFAVGLVLEMLLPPASWAAMRPTASRRARWRSGCLALGASMLHLGRPQFAFRAVLGLRTRGSAAKSSRSECSRGLPAFMRPRLCYLFRRQAPHCFAHWRGLVARQRRWAACAARS